MPLLTADACVAVSADDGDTTHVLPLLSLMMVMLLLMSVTTVLLPPMTMMMIIRPVE